MPIILINGANGHGKGQLAIKEILDLQDKNDKREQEGKPRRQIYANIHGINEEGVKPLKDVKPIPSDKIWFGKQDDPNAPPPDDYFVPPIGSIFIYDECQRIDWIKQKAGALSSDPRIISMEEHRHAGLDIYLICQGANYVHTHLHDLISPHYYVERPLGMAFTNVFMFNKYQKNVTSPTVLKKADDQYVLKLGKTYGQYYKSSAEHNIKAKYPLKLKMAIGALIAVIILSALMWLRADDKKEQASVDDTQTTQVDTQTVDNPYDGMGDMPVDNAPVGQTPTHLLQKYLPQHIAETAYYEDVRASMVIESDTDCRVFNKYGELLSYGDSDCRNMSANPALIPRSRQVDPVPASALGESASSGDLVSVNPIDL